jgi:CheY-like chemotaxis protein
MTKVLIVDDDALLRQAYRVALEAGGYEVEETTDGKHGLEAVEKVNPDVMLVDMLMPYMGGIDFLEAYDAPNKHPHVKIIALTNSVVPEDTPNRALELGASLYLKKSSLTPQQVVGEVDKLVGGA